MRYLSVLFLLLLLLTACNSNKLPKKAPDYTTGWQPVNVYEQGVQVLPVKKQTLFRVSPLDAGLRDLLTRWAREAGGSLSYQNDSDLSLPWAVAQINALNINDAVSQVNAAYRAYGISVMLSEGNQIVVTRVNGVPVNNTQSNIMARDRRADPIPLVQTN